MTTLSNREQQKFSCYDDCMFYLKNKPSWSETSVLLALADDYPRLTAATRRALWEQAKRKHS